jgi:predicted S18 family serine protease
MSIKRYTVIFEEEHIGECETGKFVLYTDHLAVVAEKEEEIRKLIKLDHKKNLTTTALIEQIAALTARIKELTEALEKYVELDKTRIAEAVLKESN